MYPPFIFVTLYLYSRIVCVNGLWPIPRSLETGTKLLKLSPSFSVELHIPNALEPPKDLLDAISRTKLRLQNDKLGRLIQRRGEEDRGALASAPSLNRLTLTVDGDNPISSIASESVKAIGSRSEGYSLTVPADGSYASISAGSSLGLLRGLTTFEQLWYWVPSSDSTSSELELDGIVYAYQAPVTIKNDAPAFVSALSVHIRRRKALSNPYSLTVDSCWTLHATCTSTCGFQTVLHLKTLT